MVSFSSIMGLLDLELLFCYYSRFLISSLVLVRLETLDELTGSPKSDTFSSTDCCMSSGWMKLPPIALVLPPMF